MVGHLVRPPPACGRPASLPPLLRQRLMVARGVQRVNGASTVAKPITKEDLVGFLASGCKPRDKWRIGTEVEKLGYKVATTERLTYDEIRQLLEGLVQRFGWTPSVEGDTIIGAKRDGQSVTLEPGGQFELSGAPVDTLHNTCTLVNQHLDQVKEVAEEIGVAFLGIGFDPKWPGEEVPVMPKTRYRVMRDFLPKRGDLGNEVMFRSCTTQVNLDFESEEDMVEKIRIGLALQPLATALFANSPFRNGQDTGYLSWRSHVWTDVDPDRTGTLPFVWQPGFGFEAYVDYALDVPMMFLIRGGSYLDATQQRSTFRDFMEGRLHLAPGERPTLKDWEMHLTTIYPEVRLKRYIEMRGADCGPPSAILALSAFWVGLLYGRESQAAAYNLIRDWTTEEHNYLRAEVPRTALHTPFRSGTLQDLAKQVLPLSRQGLTARDFNEEGFLAPLEAIAQSGVTIAERLRERFHGAWGGNIDHVYHTGITY